MKKFEAKIAYGLLVPIVILHLGFLIYPFLKEEAIKSEVMMVSIILIGSLAFILHLFFRTIYVVDSTGKLIIKSGIFFSTEVDINKIKSIEETNNILAAPAPSLDRLSLKYGKYDEILISPKNKKEFVSTITKINPSVIVNIQSA